MGEEKKIRKMFCMMVKRRMVRGSGMRLERIKNGWVRVGG